MVELILESCFLVYFWCGGSVAFLLLWLLFVIPYTPTIVKDLSMYGKVMSARNKTIIENLIQVPKSYFKHFYLTSVIANGYLLWTLVNVYFLNGHIPSWYLWCLNKLTYYPVNNPTVSHLSVILMVSIIVVQGLKRFIECITLSKYSKATMNVAHYILGLTFYFFSGLTVLSEAPDLSKPVPFSGPVELFHGLRWYHIAAVALYTWSSIHQYNVHKIFANLRKSDKDKNVHKIPYGDWFLYVSCPHYFFEILIYTAGILMLGFQHRMWYMLYAFVVTNQVAASYTVHQWYRTKFEDYPKDRMAVIPFIY
ncbi:polyprenol reductase-like [Anneissia japonica]|uniref:polyprenol reductase-like n=1 Tax=Anneissia japonica TaxID=1529436 RepID=UPI001425A898|nr:polyprenol reductase-like [Anneissia japonica]